VHGVQVDDFLGFEIFSAGFFTLEYAARIWSCSIEQKYRGWRGRLRWGCQPLQIVDAVCLVAFYVDICDVKFAPHYERMAVRQQQQQPSPPRLLASAGPACIIFQDWIICVATDSTNVCILQGTIYFRMLRLLRLLSLFKVERQVRAFAVMQKVLVSKMSQLLVCLYAMIVIVALFGSCMYFLVRNHAPKQQST
jgi:hypothetical protein